MTAGVRPNARSRPAARRKARLWPAGFSIGPLAQALLAACVLSHCGFVLGAGDYAVGDAGRDGGAAGYAAGGDSDGGTQEASKGDAAVDVDAASFASDAADDFADASPVCGQGLPVGQSGFDAVVRGCVLAVSCDPYLFNENIGQCITLDFLSAYASLACLTTIEDCNGFLQCRGYRATTSADCPTGTPSVRCDTTNNLAVDCDAGVIKSCDQYGGTCGLYSSNGTSVGCIVVPSCTNADGLEHCSRDTEYTCVNGVGFGENCDLQSETCSASDAGVASCLFDAPSCSTPGVYTCESGVLHDCGTVSRQYSYNCAAVGLSCVANGAAGYCLAPGCQPTPPCPAESCGPDGKTMTVCVGGAPYKIDCTTIGQADFTRCETVVDSTLALTYAFCR